MALDAQATVSAVEGVQDAGGSTVPAASSDFVHEPGENVDVNASTEQVNLVAPDRADSLTVHVEFSGAGSVEVQFHAQSDYSGQFTERSSDELADYSVSGAGDVFVTTDVASPYIRVLISDDSAAANSVDYNIYVR